MADDKKFAGFICTGCGIGERLDAGQLETTAKRDGKMAICHQHEMLCSKEGVQLIRDTIDNDGATHVMIAACSRRAKGRGIQLPDVAMSRANLREGVIWARPDTDDGRARRPRTWRTTTSAWPAPKSNTRTSPRCRASRR